VIHVPMREEKVSMRSSSRHTLLQLLSGEGKLQSIVATSFDENESVCYRQCNRDQLVKIASALTTHAWAVLLWMPAMTAGIV